MLESLFLFKNNEQGLVQVMKLVDEVESIFTKHFAGSDRKKAMKFLRPQQPKESHTITFFAGTSLWFSSGLLLLFFSLIKNNFI